MLFWSRQCGPERRNAVQKAARAGLLPDLLSSCAAAEDPADNDATQQGIASMNLLGVGAAHAFDGMLFDVQPDAEQALDVSCADARVRADSGQGDGAAIERDDVVAAVCDGHEDLLGAVLGAQLEAGVVSTLDARLLAAHQLVKQRYNTVVRQLRSQAVPAGQTVARGEEDSGQFRADGQHAASDNAEELRNHGHAGQGAVEHLVASQVSRGHRGVLDDVHVQAAWGIRHHLEHLVQQLDAAVLQQQCKAAPRPAEVLHGECAETQDSLGTLAGTLAGASPSDFFLAVP
eukprot:scaffold2448_cov250-Pinguiococcus_pyrenoidosus.AAC.10